MNDNGGIANILNDLSQTAIINVMLIVVEALLLIALGQRALVWLANKLSGKYRLFMLASVPLFCDF